MKDINRSAFGSARPPPTSTWVGRTRMPPGPALLALRTGAPLFVVDMWFEPDAACGRLKGPVPLPTTGSMEQRIRELTQTVADLLAEGIAAHPEDWHMLQRLWLADQAPARPDRGAE